MPNWLPTALCFLWYLLTIGSVYLIMPIRGAFLMTNFGAGIIPFTFMANAVATGFAVWVYGRFAHLPRRKLIGGTLAVIWSTLLIWAAAAASAADVPWVSFLFSVWTDIFLILSVTIFWSAIDDIFSLETAKTSFGTIAAAGPLGAILGSSVSNFLVHKIGAPGMLLISAGSFALILPIFSWLDRWAEATNPGGKKSEEVRKIEGLAQFVEVGRAIVSSRILLLITLSICFECIVPNLMTYILSKEMAIAFPARDDMAQAFARFFLLTNSIGFLVSLFLTKLAFAQLGVGGAMATCALVSCVGMASFAFWPLLAVTIAGKTCEDLMRFTLYRSAKEAIYTVAPREVVYRVKAYVEVFVYRLASGTSGLILLVLTNESLLALGTRAVAIAAIPLSVVWIAATLELGREFLKMKEQTAS